MALTAVFEVPGMTREQYDAVMKRLAERGEASPEGRVSHVASQAEDGWFVVDVWENEELFGRFAGVLVPVLGEVGVAPPQPRLLPTHNVVAAS